MDGIQAAEANAGDFNRGIILPTLIRQLKAILQQYPDDGQILKELIQNAEDAGARRIIFLLDTTYYQKRPDKLHHPNLAAYQGPALYVYNDAVFTSDDWKGIRMLNDSVKEKDPMKVGRFGLGFKSVFHMTDLPSIFSGNGIGFLDPHELFFTNEIAVGDFVKKVPTSSYMWDLKDKKDDILRLEDQFLPYHHELFGITKQTFHDENYDGTVFRFPLRMEGMKSELCDTKYSVDSVRGLFRSLETDAHILLLFLKSLERIEVYEKTSQGISPTRVMSIEIPEKKLENVREKRKQFIDEIQTHRSEKGNTSSVSITYPFEVEFQNYQSQSVPKTSHWIISQYFGGASDLTSSVRSICDNLGVLPWVGVALLHDENSTQPSYLHKPKGHLFCFLPLPLEEESPTGLRVHVHGYFAVDSNRRHLKWPTADQNVDQLTDESLLWNEFLANTLAVKAAISLALYIADSSNNLKPELIFDVIPDKLTPHWRRFAEAFYNELPKLDIFYSTVSGGTSLNTSNAFFDDIEDRSDSRIVIRNILQQNKTCFVSAPRFLETHFQHSVTPTLICESLKNVQDTLSLTDQQKFLVLEYLLKGLNGNYGALIGTRLLPLADGSWTEFKQSGLFCEKVYIESKEHPRCLLPGLDRLFLRSETSMIQEFQNIAQQCITQLDDLQPNSFSYLLRSIFPESWQNKDEVNRKEAPLLSDDWLQQIWLYLSRQFPYSLTDFENLCILPNGSNELIKLSIATPSIASSHSGIQLASDMKDVIRKIGIRLIDNLHSSVLKHPYIIGNYILQPDATNFLTAFRKWHLQGKVKQGCISMLSDGEKKTLQKFLSTGLAGKSQVVKDNQYILHSMPIFQTLDGSGFMKSEFVPLNSVNRAAPRDFNVPVNLPVVLLDLREDLTRALAMDLGVEQCSCVELLENHVFPAVNENIYSKEDVRKLMCFVYENMSRFETVSTTFIKSAANVRFIERQTGELLVSAINVFDCNDLTLCSLYATEYVFPTGEFANAKYRAFLQKLGIKGQDSVKASDILEIAQRIDSFPNRTSAQAMFTFLENHSNLLGSTVLAADAWTCVPLSSSLKRLHWVIPNSSKPANYPKHLKFVGEANSVPLFAPADVCSSQFGLITGSVKAIVDTDKIPNVSKCFGWLDQPRTEDVVQHLQNLISSYTLNKTQKLEFQFTLLEIYKDMNAKIHDQIECFDELKNMEWIWHGEGFAHTNRVMKSNSFMDLRPHIYQLPEDLRKFFKLWEYFGLKETCNLTEILKLIRDHHEKTENGPKEVKRDLQISLAILNEISLDENKCEILDQLLIPIKASDDKLCLKEINDVTYCDEEWIKRGVDISNLTDDEIHLVHHLVPLQTAKSLNIHELKNRILAVEELGFEFESFGQSEPLTRRLKGILKDYTDGLAVLKELIQNADDAGATEVKFLYDERQNNDARTILIDQGMTDLQGAALWSYNDATFSSQDFNNLVKLSGATKEECKHKIGRFGLGFNAVYNITDVPSLVSQNHFVILDPHTKYLNSAIHDKGKPGIKLDLKRSRKQIQLFIDQFKPYNGIFGCDFSPESHVDSYSGTLFRFPLRTPQQAVDSKICNKPYTHEEVIALLELLSKSSHHLLLFTQHVRKISVFHLPLNAATPNNDVEEWFVVEKNLDRTVRSIDNNGRDEIARQYAILETINKALTDVPSKTPVAVTPRIETSLVIDMSSRHSEKAAVALGVKAGSSSSHWLVVSCLGRGNSFEMSRTRPDLIPVGGIAAKLSKVENDFRIVNLASVSSKSCPDETGLLFCFLPLPIRSPFPVHLNGSFAVTSSRMHIYENVVMDKEDFRACWNEVLMKDAIKTAYLILLEDLIELCCDYDPFSLWPVHKSLAEVGSLSNVTDALYECILSDDGPRILNCCGKLVSTGECRFLEPSYRHESIGVTALKTFQEIKSLDFYVIDVPMEVYGTIKQTSACSKLEAKMVTKAMFYECYFLPNINTVDANDRETLILDALFDESLHALLRDVACISSLPNRTLKKCSDLINPESWLAVLYDVEEERFPDVRGFSGKKDEDIYRKMVVLGMKQSELSWKEISKRCLIIPSTPRLVTKRLDALIRLMSIKKIPVAEDDAPYVEEIKKIRFLPVAVKPDRFPLKWKGDDFPFVSCEESYLSTEKDLVCCVFPVINEAKTFKHEKHELKTLLGLAGKHPNEEDVFSQLMHVAALADSKGRIVTQGVENTSLLNHLCDDVLKTICKAIYKYIDDHVKKGLLSANMLQKLWDMKCIYIDNTMTLMRPSRSALSMRVASESLLPHMAKIPIWMRPFEHFLNSMKIQDSFQIEDFLQVLTELHDTYSGMILSDHDMQVVLQLINFCLADAINKSKDATVSNLDPNNIHIPDADGILCKAESLCYNNCPWIIVEEETHFCSDHILYPIASKLGVKTIREEIVEKYSDEMDFGQSEELINRLKRILSGYPFDKEVLKEMLQNADDAGALEIHFINDKRHLPDEKVFEDKWKPLQGPALCVFNNKPFTRGDLKGIQNLGEGSKSNDPTKTGQYGVGFNCVYHLTDAPSFLTQIVDDERLLCVFDPTLKFVPRATTAKPGRLFKNIYAMKDRFPDIFLGYFEEYYADKQGTMFRLPLRTEPSQISKKVVTSEDVENLFETFKSDMYESLLFLNSVEEIQLKEVDETGSLKTTYTVTVELSPEARCLREIFRERVQKVAKDLQKKTISLKDVTPIEVSYEMVTKDGTHVDCWQIIQRFGFEDWSCVSETLNSSYVNGDIGLLPRAGLAYLKKSTRTTSQSRLFCFLPLPISLDFPVHVNGHFALDNETRRNLWKDEHGGYKTDWNKCLLAGVVAPAYCSLIRDCQNEMNDSGDIAKYHCIFPPVHDINGPYIKELSMAVYKLIGKKNMPVLPVTWRSESSEHDKKKYLWMGPNGMDDKSWKCWIDAGWKGPYGMTGIFGFFDSLNIQITEPETNTTTHRSTGNIQMNSQNKSTKKNHEVIRDCLIDCGFLLFASPMTLFHNFTKATIEVKTISPEAVLTFFTSYGQHKTLCKLDELPKPVNKTLFHDLKTLLLLLEYCKQHVGCNDKLCGLPFLVTADGNLRCFDSKSIKYEPFFNEIVPHIQDQFFNYSVFHTLGIDAEKNKQLCKVFTVQNFADVLPGLLDSSKFKGSEYQGNIQDLKRILKDDKLVWLDRVWRFLFATAKKVTEKKQIAQKQLEQKQKEQKKRKEKKSQLTSFEICKISKPDVSVVLPLIEWCLLPVNFHQNQLLFPIQKSRSVINLDQLSGYQKPFVPALKNLGIPQPLLSYFVTSMSLSDSYHLYNELLGSIEDAECVVLALAEVVKAGPVKANSSNSDCLELLYYLNDNLDNWNTVPNSIDTIQQLPVFITVYGKQVSLSGSCIYVIPATVPTKDMESWTATRGIVFLKSDDRIAKLLPYLGCTMLSETEVYCSYIFEHFELLSREGQNVHLMYVRDRLLRKLTYEPRDETEKDRVRREGEERALMECLQSLAFIPTEDNNLRCASEFFDNQNDVFHAMEPSTVFPPEPYNLYEWNDFLKKCGMISSVTQAMFINYAKNIEFKALLHIDERLQNQSSIMVKHLFEREDICSSDFLQQISNIRFVQPLLIGTEKEKLHEQFGKRNARNQLMFISFKGSIVSQCSDLVWTAQSILSDRFPRAPYFNPKLKDHSIVYSNLAIDEKAKPDTVAKHVKCLCSKWAFKLHELPLLDDLSMVLRTVYGYFKTSNWKSLGQDIHDKLQSAPCILDCEKHLLVRPDQAVFNLHPKDEISPYLIRFPTALGDFKSIFESIGSTEDATIEQFAMVLETISKRSNDEELDPNEKEAACKAVAGFFGLVEKEKEQISSWNHGNTTELFLPGNDGKMHKSTELLVNNCRSIMTRLEKFEHPMLIDLNECNLEMSDRKLESLIKKLPAYLQPDFLSSVFKEEIDRNFTEQESSFVMEIREKLLSDELREGLLRLIWNGIAKEEEVKETSINESFEGLQNIKLTAVDKIQTFLVHKGQHVKKSETILPFYAEQETVGIQKIWIIYISPTLMTFQFEVDIFFSDLAEVIHRMMNGLLTGKTTCALRDILRCSASHIEYILDRYRIKRTPNEKRLDATFRPHAGQFVPLHLHHLLKQEILLFRKGDFVALEVEDPIENIDENENEETAISVATYIMVKIIEVIKIEDEEINPTTTRYKIQDGHSIREVNAAVLYAFHRTVTNAAELAEILQGNEPAVNRDLTDVKKEIRQKLIDAWKQPEEMRKKIIKRLLLSWHPDKNPELNDLATSATQYLLHAINRLENGESLDEIDETRFDSFGSTSDCTNNNNSSYYNGAYFSYINRRAREHRDAQQKYQKNYEANTRDPEVRRRRDFIKSFAAHGRNPQPGEGRRWLRQAEWDLKAVANDCRSSQYPAAEWACYKCYQAVLKSLKGAQYARDANHFNNSNEISDSIQHFVKDIKDTDITDWTFQFQRLLDNSSYMQYPTEHQSPMIPHEAFTDSKVQEATLLAENIFNWCKKYISGI